MAAKKKKARATAKKRVAKKRAAPKAAKRKAPRRKTASRKAASRKAASKPARKTASKATKKAAKKAPVRRKQVVGEGDYEASRAFLNDQAGFVKKNKARIPKLGKEAEAALEGPEGASLLAAEAQARSHARTQEDAVHTAEQEGLDRSAV